MSLSSWRFRLARRLTLTIAHHRNEQFLSSLPSGLVCLASHQIAGRGRGGNSWVSPAGCLQFSLVLRLASSNAPKIVFLQYLFGLAVVEAIRGQKGYEEVGVRLKWPNDIYGEVAGEAEGMQRYRKIGGILVNSSYAGDDFTLVVGEVFALAFVHAWLSSRR